MASDIRQNLLNFDEKKIKEELVQYDQLRSQKQEIDKRLKELSESIKSHADKYGVKNENGSLICENENYIFGKQAKKSVKFDEEKTKVFLIENGHSDCIRTVTILDEELIELKVNRGEIMEEDIEKLVNINVSYSVMVKAKEVITQSIEQQEVKKEVAQVKKPLLRRKK